MSCVYKHKFNFCIEPVGAKAPTFSTTSKSFTFVELAGNSFALLCQAQAFPVPLIRYCYERKVDCVLPKYPRPNMKGNTQNTPLIFIASSEPVGAKAPTFSSAYNSYSFMQPTHANFALLCQAQAFPVPLIR